MSEQLELGQREVKTRKGKNPKPEICKCGHERRDHTDGTGNCGPCKVRKAAVVDGMGPLAKGLAKLCTRYRSKSKKPPATPFELLGPVTSFALWRPDTVRPKAMGWANMLERYDGDAKNGFVRKTHWLCYLAQLKPQSLNDFFRGSDDAITAHRVNMGKKRKATQQAEWAKAAIEQLAEHEGIEPSELELPRDIVFTRVAYGKRDKETGLWVGRVDSDNVTGAMKWIRDAVCETLGFDDSILVERHASDPATPIQGKVWARYEQAHSFKEGVFGVRLEIVWGAS